MSGWPSNRLRAFMPLGGLEGKREFCFPDIRGCQILNTTGHRVGEVKEIYVDPNTLAPCFAFLDYEHFLNFNRKHYLVPWEELLIGDDYVQTRWAEEELLPDTVSEQQRNLAKHGGPGMPASALAGPSCAVDDDEMATARAV